jgi:sugar transferase (PEP-CTERM/EpsH1 system associated)
MARKSICHILYKLDYGGLENGVVNIINRLPEDKFTHTIISLKPVTDFKNRITARNVEIYELDKSDGKDLGAYRRAWTLLRAIKPDVVHTRNLPTIDFQFIAYLGGVRSLIHSEHGLDLIESQENAWRYRMLRRGLRLLPVRYVAVSRDLQEWLHSEIGIQPHRISRIYNGVDTDIFNSGSATDELPGAGHAEKKTFVIGHVGRFAPIKNQLLLVKAFCLLVDRFPSLRACLRLYMIGDGPQRAECEQLLADANASDIAWLPGFVSDMPDVYRKFDLFVLPSIREGISNTLLEAMASGIPIVATNVGGTPEVVEHGHTGTLVESDNVDALADAIKRYVSDDDLLANHGRNAGLRVRSSFSMTKMVDQYDELYSLA